MAPDLNSLPPLTDSTSTSPSVSPSAPTTAATPRAMHASTVNPSSPGLTRQNGDAPTSPSPRSASISLQAAATLNAGLQRGEPESPVPQSPLSTTRRQSFSQSPTADRRRSQVLHNLQVADPSLPAPGEMVSSGQTPSSQQGRASPRFAASPLMLASSGEPHHMHSRAPSLGELHQELENEQEFQVNRLLQEITRLQTQVMHQQQGQGQTAIANDDASDRSPSVSATQLGHLEQLSGSAPRSPGLPFHPHPRASFDAARAAELYRRSRTPSRGASPRFRATSISGDSGEQWLMGGRDESAFYQAETQMLTRENQMLRHRIRDLERQLSEAVGHGSTGSTHEPSYASRLHRSTSVSEEAAATSAQPASSSLPTVTDTPKEE